jgi:hypothetical protein
MRSHDAAISAQIQRLAVKIEGRVLIAAGAARSAAELSKRHRGPPSRQSSGPWQGSSVRSRRRSLRCARLLSRMRVADQRHCRGETHSPYSTSNDVLISAGQQGWRHVRLWAAALMPTAHPGLHHIW